MNMIRNRICYVTVSDEMFFLQGKAVGESGASLLVNRVDSQPMKVIIAHA